ncbi:rasGEF domain-containing protein [Naegleria gruberi]|uniref:RasGEF domain-containing protein n=1 Tax=Naegleria gruberi TaxID=5762 RepID=D2V4D2_NAEGR|nr:rasGEF domain-containing protein [Naegleria gruberi]EFC48495.1 rasGEF domain-containing protein [Naegleria gruberi]|eukprot:XP_002681239.1 rasGEF domain-containing protein [Naegleria gruberi strain NEG-M]
MTICFGDDSFISSNSLSSMEETNSPNSNNIKASSAAIVHTTTSYNNNSTTGNNLEQILIISLSSGLGGFFLVLLLIGAVFVFIKIYCKRKSNNKKKIHSHRDGIAIRVGDDEDGISSVMDGQSNDGSIAGSFSRNEDDSGRLLKNRVSSQQVMSIDNDDQYRIDTTRFMEGGGHDNYQFPTPQHQQQQENNGKYHRKFNSSPSSSPLINREDIGGLVNYQTVPSTSLLLSMIQQDSKKPTIMGCDDYLGEQNVANSELLIHIRNHHIPKCVSSIRNTNVESANCVNWSCHESGDISKELILKDSVSVENSNFELEHLKSITLTGLFKLSETNDNIRRVLFDLHLYIFPNTHLFVNSLLSLEDCELRKSFIEYFLRYYSRDLDSFDEYCTLSELVGVKINQENFKNSCIHYANEFRSWSYPNTFTSWSEFLKSFEGSFEASSTPNHPSNKKIELDKSIIKPIASYLDEFSLIKSPLVLSIANPEIIAQHLTAMDALLLRNVNIHKELTLERYANVNCQTTPLYKTDLQYSTSQCPSLSLYIDYFNKLGIFVKFCIFYKNLSLQERASCIEKFLDICQHLEKLGNYNSLMAIYGSLTSQCVSRLKNVWSKVEQKYQDYLTTLDSLFMIRKKFENLRVAQFTRYTPIIPYFGLFMTEMTQIESIHSTTIQNTEHRDKSFFNMVKLGQIYRIHQQIETCQSYANQYLSLPIDTVLFNRLQEEIIGFDLLKLELLFEKKEKSPSRSISMDSGCTSTSSGTDTSLTPRLSVHNDEATLVIPSESVTSPPTTPRGKKKNISELADKEFATLSVLICPKRSNSQTGGTPNRLTADSFIGGLWEKLSPKRLSFSNFTLPVPQITDGGPTSPRRSSVTTVSPRLLSVEDAHHHLKKFSDSDSKLLQSKQISNLNVITSPRLLETK